MRHSLPFNGPISTLKLAAIALSSLIFSSLPALSQTKPATRTHIVWDKSSLRLVARGGNYGRIIRLKNGRLLSIYERGRAAQTRQSSDEGKTWSEEIEVARSPLGSLANPEALQTKDGSILVFTNLRPSRNQNPAPNYAICVSRSVDGGNTFAPLQTLFKAGTEGDNGCWEPVALQLPSGEIQLFFADESPYIQTSEQQITLLRSHDNGLHWSAPEAVSFRARHRDGMPVPVRLPNGDLAFAIEDNGLSGAFKPTIIHTTKNDLWKSGTITATSPHRWGALLTPLAASVYAGAPYLRVLRNGETALSFQQADDGNMDHSKMTVCIGDKEARNFTNPAYPFDGFNTSAQLWNALFVKDKNTLTAITSTRVNNVAGLWTIEGRIVRN